MLFRTRTSAPWAVLAAAGTVLAGIVQVPASATSATAAVKMVTVSSGVPSTPPPRRIVSGWIPYWNTGAGTTSVDNNARLFNDVSPFWFDARGSAPSVYLVNETSGISASSVVADYHSHGVQVIPTVTDGTGWRQMAAQLSTSSGRAAMVSNLYALITSIGADGVDLDWEAFAFSDGSSSWSTTRPNWIAFVQSLAAKFHAGHKIVSITVPAGTPSSCTDWATFSGCTFSDSTGYWVYAWHAISPYTDRLRIMTYDYSPSTPGPMAPYPWVDAVAGYAVTQIAASKVQIGVPTYGRDWYVSGTLTSNEPSFDNGHLPNMGPAGSTSTQTATFLDSMNWALGRHVVNSSYASTYISTLFQSAMATTSGISFVQKPVSTWNSFYKERNFPYQVSFAGRYQYPVTPQSPSVGGAAGGTTLYVNSGAGIAAGQSVTASGVAATAKVSSLNGQVVTLSVKNLGDSNGSVTFSVKTTAKAVINTPTLTVASATGIVAGQRAVGTGIPANTLVKSVSGTMVTLTANVTAALSSTPVTFHVDRYLVGGIKGSKQVMLSSRFLRGGWSDMKAYAVATGTGIGSGAQLITIRGNIVSLSVANAANVSGNITFTPPVYNATYTISRVGWYSEAQAALARATLVNKYHLRGIAEWTIGGEDPAQWSGLGTYAQSIAAWPSVVTLSGPSLVSAGTASSVYGTATFKGTALAGAPVTVQVRKLGSTSWSTVATTTTSSTGTFSATIPGQSANFSWRATVSGDGWLRLAATATGQATVPVPAVITPNAPRTLLPGQAGKLAASVRFNGSPLPNVTATLQLLPVNAASGTPWTTVGSGITSSTGYVAVAIPGQQADFKWRLTIPGDSYGRLPSVASGVTGIAVPSTAAITSSGPANYLSTATLKGTVLFKGKPVVAKLSIAMAPLGTTSWTTVATPTTSSAGYFSATLPGRATSYSWRVYVPGDGYTRLATSFVDAIGVRLSVSAHAVSSTVKSGTRPVIAGTELPARTGSAVAVYRWSGSTWVLQATGVTGSSGTFSLPAWPLYSGTWRYRVVVKPPAGAPNLPGSSAVVSVSVG